MYYFLRISVILTVFLHLSCRHIEADEKIVDIPRHEWRPHYQAVLSLPVKDSGLYYLYLTVRHTQRFAYTSLPVALSWRQGTSPKAVMLYVTLPLTNKAGQWNGQNIDDLYDHRIRLNQPIHLSAGPCFFTLQQKVNTDPLYHVLNVGVGIKKAMTH